MNYAMLSSLATSKRTRYTTSFFLGMLASLAMPPVCWVLALLPSFSLWLWLQEQTHTRKESMWLGWWWGFGHFLTSLYWIAWAPSSAIEEFGWLIPVALFGIPALLAWYNALIGWMMAWLPKTSSRSVRTLCFVLLWACIEWVRGHAFTGFPWNLMGYAWSHSLPMLQWVGIFSIYGLTTLTLLLACMPYLLFSSYQAPSWYRRFAPLLGVGALWILMYTYGTLHLAQTPPAETHHTGIRLHLIQANIGQQLRMDTSYQQEVFAKHLALTRQANAKKDDIPTLILWAEAALPYVVYFPPEPLGTIGSLLLPNQLLIMGAVRNEQAKNHNDAWYNSMIAFDPQGTVRAVYDKMHLVPFGEYVPLRWFRPMAYVAEGLEDISAGTGPQLMKLPAPFPLVSPLVCYEGIFPGVFARKNNAQWILNLTNDGWYGHTSGPYQHFAQTRVRAIEEGLPVVRVANSGISGVVDGYGHIISATALGKEAILTSYLPSPSEYPTLFSTYGFFPFFLLILVIMIVLLFIVGYDRLASNNP